MLVRCVMCSNDFVRGKSGVIPKYCHACRKIRHLDAARKFTRANVESRKEQSREYYHANKAKEIARNEKYRSSKKDVLLEKGRLNKRNDRLRYQTYEHKRRAILLGLPGKWTKQEWVDLCAQYGYRCLCCGLKTKLTLDHVIPLCKGGDNTIGNIQPLCLTCNLKKNRHHCTDYRPKLGVDGTVNAEVYFGSSGATQ